MIVVSALIIGGGLTIVSGVTLWLLIRVGTLREPSWLLDLKRSNPRLRGAVFYGAGLMCGTAMAVVSMLIADLIFHQPNLWVTQLRAILIANASMAAGGLAVHSWFQLANLRKRRKYLEK